MEVPEIQFFVCGELLGHALAGYPYSREVNEQVLFSGAAFTVEHPNVRERTAVFSAGVEGALRAYDALSSSRRDARSAFLDDLAARRERGQLAAHVADLARARCPEPRLELFANLGGTAVALVFGWLISLRVHGGRARSPGGAEARARLVRRIVFICTGYYLAVGGALHALKPEFDPRVRFMSEYVFGPYGWLMTTTFFVLGVGVLAAAVGLRHGLHSSSSARIGLGLLTVVAVSVCLAGVFRAGMPHLAASVVVFPGIVMATLLLSRSFGQAAGWMAIHAASLALALGMLAALVAMVGGVPVPGLMQRAFLLMFLLWLAVVAHRLVRVGVPGNPAGPPVSNDVGSSEQP